MREASGHASLGDSIQVLGRTVEVDCESPLATKLISRGWYVHETDGEGHCDAVPPSL